MTLTPLNNLELFDLILQGTQRTGERHPNSMTLARGYLDPKGMNVGSLHAAPIDILKMEFRPLR